VTSLLRAFSLWDKHDPRNHTKPHELVLLRELSWIVLPDERNRPKTPERSSLPILCNGNQGAQNQGYQYGLQTGASDAQRGQNYSPQRSHYYQQASSQAFRNGFVRGYNQGYR